MANMENARKIAAECADKYGDDIPMAVEAAERRIRKLPEFEDIVSCLVTGCVRSMVHDARHDNNTIIKKQTGCYGSPAKVNGVSVEVEECYRSAYSYCIAGRMLGNILGSELLAIARNERNVGNGHIANADMLVELDGIVAEDQTVQQAVPEKKLWAMIKKYNRKLEVMPMRSAALTKKKAAMAK